MVRKFRKVTRIFIAISTTTKIVPICKRLVKNCGKEGHGYGDKLQKSNKNSQELSIKKKGKKRPRTLQQVIFTYRNVIKLVTLILQIA